MKPRAIAVLCALRLGPRGTQAVADAIGDTDSAETYALLRLMASGIDGTNRGRCLVLENKASSSMARWGLTQDGLGWLQSQGLDASESAKQAMYSATDALA